MIGRRGFLKLLAVAAVVPLLPPIQLTPVTTDADKIALVQRLLQQGLDEHDRLLEQALFSTTKEHNCGSFDSAQGEVHYEASQSEGWQGWVNGREEAEEDGW